jgi:colanic acid/amylovoran biosynthesis glycosyltransferase
MGRSKQKSARIVLFLASFPRLSETFIVNKFLVLLKNGWDVHIVCAESDPHEWDNFTELTNYLNIGERVHVRWLHRPRWLAALLIPVALLRCLVYQFKTTIRYLAHGWKIFGFDVFRRLYLDAEVVLLRPALIHFEFGALAVEQMHLKKLLDSRILVSFRGYDLNFTELNHPGFYDNVWKQADELHLLSEHLWHVAQERGCPSDKPYTLIPPAIDTSYFMKSERKTSSGDVIRILSVGRLEWKKGYEYALQAVKLLIDRGIACEYHLIGDGNYREALYFARHQLSLKNVAVFLGAQPPDAIRAQMNWADIFLHPSLSEGFCNVVIEAQSMEIPVVASDAGGLKENVEPSVTGFIVPRRDTQALADKMEMLALNSSLRKKMGTAGRKRALQYFQIEDQIRKFQEVYSRLLRLQ